MRQFIQGIVILLFIGLFAGCAQHKQVRARASYFSMAAVADGGKSGTAKIEVRPDRMLIWKARLTLKVADVPQAVRDATAAAESQGGFVEQNSDQGEESASVTIRVPTKKFKVAVDRFESLGKVTDRNVEGEDVTEQYVDIEARLKNNIQLRDKLKALLEKASDVKDIVSIETEMNRIQSEIDSMEGRIKSLKGKVDYSTIVLTLERKSIKGPLGYFFSGLWWGIEKLFIIRE